MENSLHWWHCFRYHHPPDEDSDTAWKAQNRVSPTYGHSLLQSQSQSITVTVYYFCPFGKVVSPELVDKLSRLQSVNLVSLTFSV